MTEDIETTTNDIGAAAQTTTVEVTDQVDAMTANASDTSIVDLVYNVEVYSGADLLQLYFTTIGGILLAGVITFVLLNIVTSRRF